MSVSIGDPLPLLYFGPVDPEAMKIWAKALHDPNPIHLDRAAVAAAGLGERRINQGPANLAYLVNMLAAAFPGHRIAGLNMRFLGNVFEGERVSTGGTVSGIDMTITCDVWLDAGDRRVLAGTATMMEKS